MIEITTTTKFENVMVIDDNEIDLYIVSRIISINNFSKNTLSYSYAKEALNYLQENQGNISLLPQVIFVDIFMPMMSGFEFMEAFDKLPATVKNYCKVFVISSSNNEDDINRAHRDKNIVNFQEKPIQKDFLASIAI